MNIKKTITAMAMAMMASTIAFGGGLYIVSGGDFRRCDAYWKVVTT